MSQTKMFCYFNSFFFTLINSVLDKFTIKYIIKVYFTALAAGYVKRSKYMYINIDNIISWK